MLVTQDWSKVHEDKWKGLFSAEPVLFHCCDSLKRWDVYRTHFYSFSQIVQLSAFRTMNIHPSKIQISGIILVDVNAFIKKSTHF